MTSPKALRARLVEMMQDSPDLVALLNNDPANILEYEEDERGDLLNTIMKLPAPRILVYIEGVAGTRFPSLIRVGIGIAVRANDPFSVYQALCDGVSTASGSDGLPMLNSTILFPFTPMEIPSMERRMIPVGEDRVFDYWEIRTGFSDKG